MGHARPGFRTIKPRQGENAGDQVEKQEAIPLPRLPSFGGRHLFLDDRTRPHHLPEVRDQRSNQICGVLEDVLQGAPSRPPSRRTRRDSAAGRPAGGRHSSRPSPRPPRSCRRSPAPAGKTRPASLRRSSSATSLPGRRDSSGRSSLATQAVNRSKSVRRLCTYSATRVSSMCQYTWTSRFRNRAIARNASSISGGQIPRSTSTVKASALSLGERNRSAAITWLAKG
jgi:hypothetical protein